MIIRNKDADAYLRRRTANGGSGRGDLVRAEGSFLFSIHAAELLFRDNVAVIVVPLPGELTSFNLPPISSTRSRMPVRPKPSWRSLTWHPSPSSESSRRTSFALRIRRVRKCLAWAYLSALVKAFWPMRNKCYCEGGGRT